MNAQECERQIQEAFDIAFARALERWTFDLRRENNNFMYIVSQARNEWCSDCRLYLEWSKPV